MPPGAHRFVAAPGYKPDKETTAVLSIAEGVEVAIKRFGAPLISVWRSLDFSDWMARSSSSFGSQTGEGTPWRWVTRSRSISTHVRR